MILGSLLLLGMFAVVYLIFFKPSSLASDYDQAGNKVEKKKPLPPLVFPKATLPAVVALVLAQQVLLYETVIGAGWGLFLGIAGVVVLFFFRKTQRTPIIYSMVIALLIASVAATFRANGFVQVVNGIFVVGLFTLLVFLKTYQNIRWNGIWLLKYGLLILPETIRHFFRVLSETGSQSLKAKNTNSFSVVAVIKTVALTLLVLAVFVALLSNADPVFARLIRDVWESAIGRVVTGILVSIGVLLIATFSLKTEKEEAFTLNFFSFWDVFIPVFSAGILFGVFLFVQSRYLFGGHQDLALFDLTYSEYVRKGFIELMWASLFGSLLTYFVYLKNQMLTDAKQSQALKIVNALFAGELVLLVASAFKRNLLYIDIFGLTRVRVVGNYFLIWLVASVLLLLAMTLLSKMKEKHFFSGMWIVSLAVVFGLNVVNIDALVFASSPALEDESEGTIKDYFYLANLSEDVAEEWGPMVAEIEQQVTEFETKAQGEDFSKSELQRMANAKLALLSLSQRWERLDTKYGEANRVKELYFETYEELPKWTIADRKMASLKIGELRGYQVMAQDTELYSNYLGELVEKIDSLVADRDDENQSLSEYEWTLLYDYRRPFISTNLDYYPDYNYGRKPTVPPTYAPLSSPSPSATPSPSVVPSVFPSSSPSSVR